MLGRISSPSRIPVAAQILVNHPPLMGVVGCGQKCALFALKPHPTVMSRGPGVHLYIIQQGVKLIHWRSAKTRFSRVVKLVFKRLWMKTTWPFLWHHLQDMFFPLVVRRLAWHEHVLFYCSYAAFEYMLPLQFSLGALSVIAWFISNYSSERFQSFQIVDQITVWVLE